MKCEDCGKEMEDPNTKTCDKPLLVVVDPKTRLAVVYERIPVEPEVSTERCHDCHILKKYMNVHHRGCDMERCPKCNSQLISCGCFDGMNVYSGSEANS